VATLLLLTVSAVCLFPGQGDLYRVIHLARERTAPERVYIEEGIEGVVVTMQWPSHMYHYINGSAHGRRPGPGYHNEAMVALSCTANPKKALIIGFGSGTIAETVLLDDRVEEVTMVEINNTSLLNLHKIAEIDKILKNEKLTVVIEDARRYLQRTDDRYDIIIMDPLRTRSAYSNNIYSVEFIKLLQGHLVQDGKILIWIDNHTVLPNTVSAVFAEADKYQFFIVASDTKIFFDPQTYENLLCKLDPKMISEVRKHYRPVQYSKKELLKLLERVPVNSDYRPVTEYYLGNKH
jgi:spermidine synthase